jgi:hypothetical protein
MTQDLPLNWLELYRAALAELDKERLVARVDLAQKAMLERSSELAQAGNSSVEEKEKIEGALTVLRVLLRQTATAA